MTTVTDQREVKRLIELVRQYLEPHQPADGSYRLEVVPEAIQQEDDWYYIVVRPSREDVRSYDYNARLVEAEIDLQVKEGKKVLLVPL